MKKLLTVLMVLLLTLSMAGCGKKPEDKAKETVESFLKALETANLDEAGKCMTPEANSELQNLKASLDVSSSLNLGEYDPDGSITKLAQSFSNKIVKEFFKSHTLGDIEKKDDKTIVVKAKIKTLDNTQFASGTLMDDLVTQITTENMTALIQLYLEKGEAAMTAEVMRMLFDYLDKNADKILGDLPEVEEDVEITCTETDGKWLISKLG